jgi:hypothetical protein
VKSVLASETLLFEFNILATLVIGSMTLCSWKQLGMAWDMGAGSPTGMRVYWTGERARLKMADLPEVDLSKVPPVCVYVYVFMCAFVCVCACVCLCLCLCVQARTHICKMLCSPILKASGSTSPSFLHCVHEAVHTCDM